MKLKNTEAIATVATMVVTVAGWAYLIAIVGSRFVLPAVV